MGMAREGEGRLLPESHGAGVGTPKGEVPPVRPLGQHEATWGDELALGAGNGAFCLGKWGDRHPLGKVRAPRSGRRMNAGVSPRVGDGCQASLSAQAAPAVQGGSSAGWGDRGWVRVPGAGGRPARSSPRCPPPAGTALWVSVSSYRYTCVYIHIKK